MKFEIRPAITKQSINNMAQNKPTLIVKDICTRYPDVDPDFVYSVLLARGVFKWLAVRRRLIRLKDVWRDEIRELNRKKTDKEKGYYHALIRCRANVRALCHSNRWQAPDFDRKANEFLEGL
ncbi:hypothetical protein LCGC14_2079740 [marine sediment metagenome]|uniref:Uncharacterized protein n=1 Tax=marine sediment metagenome TaxID=412755 RepID=A0A0F9EG61_9ZZZZ|nr:hypothetical protein [Desulfobacterales bacterium]